MTIFVLQTLLAFAFSFSLDKRHGLSLFSDFMEKLAILGTDMAGMLFMGKLLNLHKIGLCFFIIILFFLKICQPGDNCEL